MVKLQGPVFSLSASGSIGRALTFSHSRKRPYAKQYARPSNPKTARQTGQRVMMGFLQGRWRFMTQAQKTSWETLPNPLNLSPYHLYTQFNLNRWRNHQLPSAINPPDAVLPYGSYQFFNWTGPFKGLTCNRNKLLDPQSEWGFVLYHSQTNGFTPNPHNAVHVQHLIPIRMRYWVHSPLPPGTHYYRWQRFSLDSKPWLPPTQYAITVL